MLLLHKNSSPDHKCAMKGVFLMELEEDDDQSVLANDWEFRCVR
jgi:hypothetical protein